VSSSFPTLILHHYSLFDSDLVYYDLPQSGNFIRLLKLLKAMENKSIFHTKDVTLKLWHGSKQDGLDRQIATAFINFNSFLNL